jgi:hypothetical protein
MRFSRSKLTELARGLDDSVAFHFHFWYALGLRDLHKYSRYRGLGGRYVINWE